MKLFSKNLLSKLLCLLFLTLLLTGCTGSGKTPDVAEQQADIKEESSDVANEPSDVTEELADVTILYTTDAHGHIVTDEETIGLDIIAGIKDVTPDSILVDSGDFLAGQPIATLTEGKDIVALMKMAGYSAAAVGNHEFDYGISVLKERIGEAEEKPDATHILSANLFDNESNALTDTWIVQEVNGIKIGMFGITTKETESVIPVKTAESITLTDEVGAAKEAVEALKNENCDLIVGIVHAGTDSTATTKSTDIAEQVEGIDVLIDGHSHAIVDEKAENEKGTIIVSSGEYGYQVGVLKLTVNKKSRSVSNYENSLITREEADAFKPNQAVADEIEKIVLEQDTILNEVVASTEVSLIGEKETIRTQETNLGNLCADATMNATGADIGLSNAGNIRATIEAGDITRGDILTVLPYGNQIVTKSLTGSQLMEVIEHSLSMLPEADGRFLQMAGICIVVNSDNPKGEKLVSIVRADGSPIMPDELYIVAVNDYIADGGDDFTVFQDVPVIEYYGTEDQIVLDYINEYGTQSYGEGEPSRIVFSE